MWLPARTHGIMALQWIPAPCTPLHVSLPFLSERFNYRLPTVCLIFLLFPYSSFSKQRTARRLKNDSTHLLHVSIIAQALRSSSSCLSVYMFVCLSLPVHHFSITIEKQTYKRHFHLHLRIQILFQVHKNPKNFPPFIVQQSIQYYLSYWFHTSKTD